MVPRLLFILATSIDLRLSGFAAFAGCSPRTGLIRATLAGAASRNGHSRTGRDKQPSASCRYTFFAPVLLDSHRIKKDRRYVEINRIKYGVRSQPRTQVGSPGV